MWSLATSTLASFMRSEKGWELKCRRYESHHHALTNFSANPQSGDLNVPVAYSEAIKWWEKVGFCASQCGQHWGSSGQHWGSSAPEGDHSTPPLSLCRRPLRTLHQLCITSA